MNPSPPHPQPAPTAPANEDRFLAAGAHLGWFVAMPIVLPLVVYLLKRDRSRLVAFHALQALIWSVLQMAVVGAAAAAGFGVFLSIAMASGNQALVTWAWVVPAVPWLGCMVLSVVASMKAYRGEEWALPIAGRFAGRAPAPPGRRPKRTGVFVVVGAVVLLVVGAVALVAVSVALQIRRVLLEADEAEQRRSRGSPPAATSEAPAVSDDSGPIGVPACDEYLARMEACFAADPAARAASEPGVRAMRTAWKRAAAAPGGKAALEPGCRDALAALPPQCKAARPRTPTAAER